MGEVNQSNVHLFLPWKVAGLASLWAADMGIPRLEAQRRFYGTQFYKSLEDESTKLWTLSPEQLYLVFSRGG